MGPRLREFDPFAARERPHGSVAQANAHIFRTSLRSTFLSTPEISYSTASQGEVFSNEVQLLTLRRMDLMEGREGSPHLSIDQNINRLVKQLNSTFQINVVEGCVKLHLVPQIWTRIILDIRLQRPRRKGGPRNLLSR